MLPTMLTLMNVRLTASGVVAGVLTAFLVGLPIFAYGTISNLSAYKTAGSLITVLSSGIIALAVSKIPKRRERDGHGK